MKNNLRYLFIYSLCILLAAGCKTIPADMTTVELILDGRETKSFFSGTSIPGTESEMTFEVESFTWFNNWHDGWTEARFSASGILVLEKPQNPRKIRMQETPVIDYPEKATIRFRDTIIEGERGLKQFGNRWNRISAASDFLASIFRTETLSFSEFSKKAQQFLFPEIYGYGGVPTESIAVKENRIRNEGIAWDIRYTEQVFPAEFQEIRNTGTLFRDWEESAELFYLAYSWKIIFENPDKYLTFTGTKKQAKNH